MLLPEVSQHIPAGLAAVIDDSPPLNYHLFSSQTFQAKAAHQGKKRQIKFHFLTKPSAPKDISQFSFGSFPILLKFYTSNAVNPITHH